MATAGPNAPGTMADDSAVGTWAWADPDNAKVSDSSYATDGGNGQGHYLKATAFGFSIPSGATINGVEVGVTRKSTEASKFNYAATTIIKLVKGGTVIGSNLYDFAVKWPTTEGTVTYGSPTELWGTTLTDSDVNASDFGVVIQAFASTVTASVNFISVTITYTAAAGGPVKQMMHTVRMRM